MTQPWIHNAKTDSLFILSPPFLVLAIIVCFQKKILLIESQYSFYTWLFLIVFVDVAHVYATLFKTYFVSSEFQKRKKLLIGLPIICFLIGVLLFSFGAAFFWSVLAYVAVFHFIRQQYGLMRLYSRNEPREKKSRSFDSLVIYTVTGYPMLYWFLSPPRNFNWFMPQEFFSYQNSTLLQFFEMMYYLILLMYVFRTIDIAIQQRYFNIPKHTIIIGTGLSWYFGIVYFNNDLIFTALNVISHGIPYMALVYLKEVEKGKETSGIVYGLKRYKKVLVYIGVLLGIALAEEYLWEITVWQEHFSVVTADFTAWHFLLVPLLVVPQFTHYILDGFIWKSK